MILLNTRIYHKDDNIAVTDCAATLKKGGIIIFPTETVYGIGVNAFDENAIGTLYQKKQRPLDKPLLMHISGIEMAESVGILTETARELIKRFTPGPLTLIVKRKPQIPSIAVSGGETVGLRFPSNKFFLELSKEFNAPIAATSANISGENSSDSFETLGNVLEIAEIAVNGGDCELGLESTILSLIEEQPRILRQGSFPRELIEEVVGKCK